MQKEEVDKLLNEKVASGEHVSPVLPEGVKNYLIDIDGTITEDVPNEEPERMATCKPFPDALKTLNKWYDQGHIICFLLLGRKHTVRSQKIGSKSTILNTTAYLWANPAAAIIIG